MTISRLAPGLYRPEQVVCQVGIHLTPLDVNDERQVLPGILEKDAERQDGVRNLAVVIIPYNQARLAGVVARLIAYRCVLQIEDNPAQHCTGRIATEYDG